MADYQGKCQEDHDFAESKEKEDAYIKEVRDKLAKDEAYAEVSKLITDIDLRRITRGYKTEKEREKETMEKTRLFCDNLKKGFYEFYKKEHSDPNTFKKLCKALPGTHFGQGKQGHPVYYMKVMDIDVNAVNATNNDLCNEYTDRMVSAGFAKCREMSKKNGMTMYKKIVVFDVYNLGLFNGRKYLKKAQEMIARESDLYAETIYKIFIVNAGRSFQAIWSIGSKFVHPLTQKKINMIGWQEGVILDALKKEIDMDQIPSDYGGNAAKLQMGTWWFKDGLNAEEVSAISG